jgi:hypothetical protein
VQRSGVAVDHGEQHAVEQERTLGHGFNLHAAGRISASDKKGRERILRYILRPPIATKRLTRRADGRVTYWLKEAWADGSKCVIFEPLDFIAKLLPLIPPPRANLIRYHGAWAPHAAIRKLVVPAAAVAAGQPGASQLALPLAAGRSEHDAKGGRAAGKAEVGRSSGGDTYRGRAHPERIAWADLAKVTFEVDTLACPRCAHSPMRVVAIVASPTRQQLAAIRSGGEVIPMRPERSRAPPLGQMKLEFPRTVT